MNDTMFCCDLLRTSTQQEKCPLKYIPYQREYTLTIPRSYRRKNEMCANFRILNCPWCGTQFPPSLSAEWHAIIEKEFGVTGYVDAETTRKLPQEFRTDEWWRKRGL